MLPISSPNSTRLVQFLRKNRNLSQPTLASTRERIISPSNHSSTDGVDLPLTMHFFQSSALLHKLINNHAKGSAPADSDGKHASGQKPLRSYQSLANLLEFVRNPVENVGEAVENWYEGNTKEDRKRRQNREERKQILYLRLHDVGHEPSE